MTQREQAQFSLRPLALGCALGLVVCFALYDVLLYSNLRREARGQALSMASVSASVLNMKIAAGLRLGKDLSRFTGLYRLLAQAVAGLPQGSSITVLLPDGRPAAVFGGNAAMDGAEAAQDGLRVSMPVLDRHGREAGRTFISLPKTGLEQAISPNVRSVILWQAVLAALAMILFLRFSSSAVLSARIRSLSRQVLLAVSLGVILLFLGISVFLSMQVYLEHYEADSRASALRIGRILNEDLNKLLLVGVSLGSTRDLDQYLKKMSASASDDSIVLSVVDQSGRVIGSSHELSTPLAEHLSFSLPLDRGRTSLSSFHREGGWSVAVSITHDAWKKGVIALALNVLTMLVIALMVMLEAFLLLFHFASPEKAALPETTGESAPFRDSTILRALLFVFLLAKDLSISFIPLRMGELAPEGGTLFMGLPVSAEIVAAACGIMLAGTWIRRSGLAPAMVCGTFLALTGNLISAFSPWPWLFIPARCLAGAGYGLVLLPAQAAAVKEGKLTFLFAGVYAGSLCGGALGAILADYLGYAPVFLVSALLMLPLLPLFLFFGRTAQSAAREPQAARPPRGALAALLLSPAFLALLCFSLIPASLMDIGLMNYFLPVFLHAAGAAQSDIGRVYMLYCLVLICLGPRIEKIIVARSAERAAVFLGMVACAAAAAAFIPLPPLAASLTGAFCLGLAVCCNIPGQSACLLRLKEARDLGVELSMSALNTVERAGQMIGPLCMGALFATAGVSTLILGGGAAALLIGGTAFLTVTRRSNGAACK